MSTPTLVSTDIDPDMLATNLEKLLYDIVTLLGGNTQTTNNEQATE